jgi:iron complex outermembrane receptor protein
MYTYKPLALVIAVCFATATVTVAAETSVTGRISQGEMEQANVMLISPIVVTATRVEQNSFDLPVSIDAVSGDVVREGQLQVNLSESAARVPGVVVNNRNNPAQDLAIQVRGFGARSAFGVRGVRLYADGIPMTMPDGQGQTGTFNLDTAKSVEYLRGPFSALYGNSSGGVVQIFTADGPVDPTLSAGLTFGSYDTRRASTTFAGDHNGFNYILNANTYRSDGYRDQSDTRRDTVHGKFSFNLGDTTKITLVATALDQPDNKDPQGLNSAQLKADRTQANPNSLKFNTRVSRSHEQLGATLEHQLTANDDLRLMAYYGQRENEQYQSVSIAAQRDDRNGGGVATIDRDFGGVDMRWAHKGKLGDSPYNFTIGISYDRMNDDRKGYENFTSNAVFGALPASRDCGNTLSHIVCGVKGNLRRDEANKASSFDQYLQAAIDVAPRLNLSAGVRHSRVRFENDDHYIVNSAYSNANGDDSGAVTFRETTPVIGAIFRVTDAMNLYVNAGESFETPTFVEMAYTSTGGFNLDLKPATSRQYEVGAKWALGGATLLNAALYRINTDDEIVVLQQSGGRTVYQNVKSSERKGFELSLDSRLGNGFSTYLSYAYLDAAFTSSFTACRPFGLNPAFPNQTTCLPNVAPSATNSGGEVISSGAAIPGTYKHTLFGEIAWKHQPSGFSTALEVRANSQTFVAFRPQYGKADGYSSVAWRGGFAQSVGGWKFGEFVRIDNLFDKDYVGSVRVSDLNGSYYESAPGRNWLLGLNASYKF